MRTIGHPDHVVVIGAGLAGLSAAMHLAGRGRHVTVLEKGSHPGGRVGRFDVDGYHFDTGPTVLTMPDIVEETLASVGDTLTDRIPLLQVDPAYHMRYTDGSQLDVHSDEERMAHAISQFSSAQDAEGYRKLRSWLNELYNVEFDRFIASNVDSPFELITPSIARLAAMGAFRKLDRAIGRFLADERLRRVFTFQSLYVGQAPQNALAVYAIIAYMDTVRGVYFPQGGMRALPEGLAAAATDAGVRFSYDTTVTELERRGARVQAVRTRNGDRIPCDALVLTTELPTTYRLLGRTPRRPLPLRAAPSAVVLHVGTPASSSAPKHHTVVFGDAWRTTFRELITEGKLMTDPSLLITRPCVTDPGLAPPGREVLSVLAPVPNLTRGSIDWEQRTESYANELTDHVRQRLIPEFGADIDVSHILTPADWAAQGMVAGTPFSLAHNFFQSGPFRPSNRPRGVDNAVLAGSSTVPGVGIPTALLSGRLAADRITGSANKTERARHALSGGER